MKRPTPKQLGKFRPIYDYYLRLGDSPTPAHYKSIEGNGVKIGFQEDGPSAIEAAWILETYGRKVGGITREPDVLAKFYDGKGWHGVNVQNWSDSLIEGTLLIGEFATDYDIPECFYDETCKAVQEKLEAKEVYCPSCYSFSREKMRDLWNGVAVC